MKEESDDIDKIFREKFKDAPAAEPMESWASVSDKLYRKGFVSGETSKTNAYKNSIFSIFLFTVLLTSVSILVKDSFKLTNLDGQNYFLSDNNNIDLTGNSAHDFPNSAYNKDIANTTKVQAKIADGLATKNNSLLDLKRNNTHSIEGVKNQIKKDKINNLSTNGSLYMVKDEPNLTSANLAKKLQGENKIFKGDHYISNFNRNLIAANSSNNAFSKKENVQKFSKVLKDESISNAKSGHAKADFKIINDKVSTSTDVPFENNKEQNKFDANTNSSLEKAEVTSNTIHGTTASHEKNINNEEVNSEEVQQQLVDKSINIDEESLLKLDTSKTEQNFQDNNVKAEIDSSNKSFNNASTLQQDSGESKSSLIVSKEITQVPSLIGKASQETATQNIQSDSAIAKLEKVDTLIADSKSKKNNATNSGPGISLGLFVMPGISQVNASENLPGQTRSNRLNDGNFHGILDAGLAINFHLGKRFFLGTGIITSSFTQKFLITETKTERDTLLQKTYNPAVSQYAVILNDSSFFNPVNSLATSREMPSWLLPKEYYIKDSLYKSSSSKITRYQYVGIPIMAGYNFGASKLQISVYSGMLINIPVSKTSTLKINYDSTGVYPGSQSYLQSNSANMAYTYTTFSTSKNTPFATRATSSIKDLANFNLMYIGGVNLNYSLGRSWSITAGPVLRYSLKSAFQTKENVKSIPYSWSLQIGVTYRLR